MGDAAAVDVEAPPLVPQTRAAESTNPQVPPLSLPPSKPPSRSPSLQCTPRAGGSRVWEGGQGEAPQTRGPGSSPRVGQNPLPPPSRPPSRAASRPATPREASGGESIPHAQEGDEVRSCNGEASLSFGGGAVVESRAGTPREASRRASVSSHEEREEMAKAGNDDAAHNPTPEDAAPVEVVGSASRAMEPVDVEKQPQVVECDEMQSCNGEASSPLAGGAQAREEPQEMVSSDHGAASTSAKPTNAPKEDAPQEAVGGESRALPPQIVADDVQTCSGEASIPFPGDAAVAKPRQTPREASRRPSASQHTEQRDEEPARGRRPSPPSRPPSRSSSCGCPPAPPTHRYLAEAAVSPRVVEEEANAERQREASRSPSPEAVAADESANSISSSADLRSGTVPYRSATQTHAVSAEASPPPPTEVTPRESPQPRRVEAPVGKRETVALRQAEHDFGKRQPLTSSKLDEIRELLQRCREIITQNVALEEIKEIAHRQEERVQQLMGSISSRERSIRLMDQEMYVLRDEIIALRGTDLYGRSLRPMDANSGEATGRTSCLADGALSAEERQRNAKELNAWREERAVLRERKAALLQRRQDHIHSINELANDHCVSSVHVSKGPREGSSYASSQTAIGEHMAASFMEHYRSTHERA